MALFQPKLSPDEKAAREISDRLAKQIKDRDGNSERLRVADGKLAQVRLRVEQLALGDDAAALDDALVAKRAAEDLVGALKAASTTISKEITTIEAEAAVVADRRQRQATAAAIERIAVDLQEAGAAFERSAAELAAAAKAAGDIVPDALPLWSYGHAAGIECPAAVAMVAEVLRHRAVLTINGQARATLPAPEAPPVLKLVEGPKMRTVFALRHLAFTDVDGRLHRFPKINDAALPVDLANEALRRSVACEVSDSRR
jgi:hypothetical protein